MMKNPAWQPVTVLNVRTLNQEQSNSLGDLTPIEDLINHADTLKALLLRCPLDGEACGPIYTLDIQPEVWESPQISLPCSRSI